ncbi:hypothetical protein E3N88_36662 [Mikania micrantha]|uniref:Uncharacterized protein n=1 Tax=Mikania micrantha TaxID=192012 RepID=A0A5N6M4V6_9ASTR|nr:hypothetical protein E3N88_36662 [Mikania micrantha]
MDSTLDLNTFDYLIASYNEESFVASELEVHPINDDPILSVDEENGYVPNLSLIREECYEIPSNGVIKATSAFVIYKFVECHNHPLVETYNRDFTKAGRKLSFSTKQFIHHMTLNNIGPTIAHRLQVSMKGGHHNVKGTPTDFKNFSRAIRLFIGNRDSQLLLDRLRDRVKNLPDFFFDFSVVKGELRHVFWADEISRKNYEVFGNTTSRCESSNASFKVNSSGANTLVQFILCYDTSIESQRYRQCLAEYKTSSRPYQSLYSKLGGSLDVDLQCSNPQGIRNKGCGKSCRLIGAGEKAVDKSLRTPRLYRTCQKYVTGHDSRNCKKKRTEAVDVTDE